MKSLIPPGWKRPLGYSNGISTRGRTIFTAGVVGWDAQELFASDSIADQFAQVLRNIVAILAEDGAGPDHLARMTVYVTDIEEYLASTVAIGEAWKEIIGRHYPAMALVQVVRLVEPQAKIEIEATAVVPE
jgi:enamine deaminase RidA (YjgF/YER057c/UK114 family)